VLVSTTSFLFPDINVWVALTCGAHVHHDVARDWFTDLPADVRFSFCRFTQLGVLRFLTAEAVMGDEVLSQKQAWAVYDRWLADRRVTLTEEPPGLERRFRVLTRSRQASPKAWANAYLAAFADVAQLTLVTFDRGFRGRVESLMLLSEWDGSKVMLELRGVPVEPPVLRYQGDGRVPESRRSGATSICLQPP
jgi:uncharacterized protein